MPIKTITMLAVAGAAAFGITACGSDGNSSRSSGAGAPAASAKPEPLAEIPSLSGRSTQVALDPGFVDALKRLALTPAPLGSARISSGGTASFPITGGNVTYYKPGTVRPFVQGEIDHDGSGLSLTGGGKVVRLTDFVVDPGRSVLTGKVSVDGRVAAPSAPLFFLDGRTLQPLKTGDGTATLQGTTVKLEDEAAQLLNQTFGTKALKGGLVIGVAKITVNTA